MRAVYLLIDEVEFTRRFAAMALKQCDIKFGGRTLGSFCPEGESGCQFGGKRPAAVLNCLLSGVAPRSFIREIKYSQIKRDVLGCRSIAC